MLVCYHPSLLILKSSGSLPGLEYLVPAWSGDGNFNCRQAGIIIVADHKRRNQLHKLLKQYGEPVQKSAFEGRLTEAEKKRLLDRATAIIDPKEDSFTIYTVARRNENLILHLGPPRPEIKVETYFIV